MTTECPHCKKRTVQIALVCDDCRQLIRLTNADLLDLSLLLDFLRKHRVQLGWRVMDFNIDSRDITRFIEALQKLTDS